MRRTLSILRRLGAIYKVRPNAELRKSWEEAFEDLHDSEIERGIEKMTREYKNPFLPPPSVFRMYALYKDPQQTTEYDFPKKPDPDYWREKARNAALKNKRLDPVGAQKHFKATGEAPDGFILDEDNVVRWDPNWKPKPRTESPEAESTAEKTLKNIISRTEGFHALITALSPNPKLKAEDE